MKTPLIVTLAALPLVVAAAEPNRPVAPPSPPASGFTFDTLDANKDGRISMPEASADPKLVETFSTADKNGDGYLDSAEFASASRQPVR